MLADRLVVVAPMLNRLVMLAVVIVDDAAVVVANVDVPVTESVPLSARFGTFNVEA